MLPTIIQLSLRTVCPSWHLEKPSCRAGPTAANNPMGPRPTSPRAPSPASTSHVWSSAETRGWLGSRISPLLLPSASGRLPQEWTSAPSLTVLDKSWLQPSPYIAGTPSWGTGTCSLIQWLSSGTLVSTPQTLPSESQWRSEGWLFLRKKAGDICHWDIQDSIVTLEFEIASLQSDNGKKNETQQEGRSKEKAAENRGEKKREERC